MATTRKKAFEAVMSAILHLRRCSIGSGEHGTRKPPPGESRPHLDLPVFDFAIAEWISVHLPLMCTTKPLAS